MRIGVSDIDGSEVGHARRRRRRRRRRLGLTLCLLLLGGSGEVVTKCYLLRVKLTRHVRIEFCERGGAIGRAVRGAAKAA